MGTSARIAVVNLATSHDKEANLAKILSFVDEAGAKNSDLVVFPECALQGYPYLTGAHNGDEFAYLYETAERIPGPATELVAEAAARHGLVVVFGMTELAGTLGPAGLLFNAVATVGPEGVLSVYRKVHTGDIEKALWYRGTAFPVVDTPIGRIGSIICYDVVFPEATRALALRGAQILLMSTVWLPQGTGCPAFEMGYDLLTRARALENQLWLAVACGTGRDPETGLEYLGHSRIVDPYGQVILELGVEEGLGIATIDVEGEILRARARGWFGQVFLRDRAPETYRIIADPSVYAPDPLLGC